MASLNKGLPPVTTLDPKKKKGGGEGKEETNATVSILKLYLR